MKTPAQRAIAKIHIAKKELALDDDTYRALLEQVTGKTSCAGMTPAQLNQVLDTLKTKGWKPKTNRRQYSPSTKLKPAHTKTPADKIRALWIHMHQSGFIHDGSEAALGKWVERQTKKYNQGHGMQSIDWVPPWMASKLIEELKKWQQRKEGER